MSHQDRTDSEWPSTRDHLRRLNPQFYELEPGGAIAMDLGDEGWILELTPDGRLICQTGMEMEDIKNLLSDGTAEDLGSDELAKQVKYYLQPAVSKFRPKLVGAGFQEMTEMTDEHVAVQFSRAVDLTKPNEVSQAVAWCKQQFC